MCKVLETINEKKAILDHVAGIITTLNNDHEMLLNEIDELNKTIADMKQDPETCRYDIKWKQDQAENVSASIKAIETIKKHLEKLV